MRSSKQTIVLGVTSEISLQFVRPLAKRLDESGWDVHVVASFATPALPPPDTSFREHHLPMKRDPHLLGDVCSLFRWILLLKTLRPDVVAIGTPKAALLGLIASKLWRIPHRVLILHGLRLETETGILRRVLNLTEAVSSRCATVVVAVSQSLREQYQMLGFARRIEVRVVGKGSALGVDLNRFQKVGTPGARKSQRARTLSGFGFDPLVATVGFVGRINADKGVPTLLHALRLLKAEKVPVQALFMGDDESPLLRIKIDAQEGARYLEWSNDPLSVYSCIDILCLPSRREGLPTVILEAGALGIPTIGARSTGIIDVVADGKNGLVVEGQDPLALARALKTLVLDKKLRERLGRNAKLQVTKHYDQDKVLDAHIDFFESLK